MIKPRSLMLIFMLTGMHAALAGLKWETTSQNIQVHPLQASTTVPFAFTNAGNEPITIADLKPSCGCITSTVEKKTYAPGESGVVRITFNLQGRLGAQHKGLAVTTDDQPTKPVQLYIDTNIPKSYESSVKRIVWEVGEDHSSKSIRLTNASKTPFPLEEAVPARDDITIELKPIRKGFEYELVITPAAELSKTLVPVIIYPEKPEGFDAVRTYAIYALVK